METTGSIVKTTCLKTMATHLRSACAALLLMLPAAVQAQFGYSINASNSNTIVDFNRAVVENNEY